MPGSSAAAGDRPSAPVRIALAAALAALGLAGVGLAGCGRLARPTTPAAAPAAPDAPVGRASAPGGVPAGVTVAVTEGEAAVSGQLPAGAVGPVSITLRAPDGTWRADTTADVAGRSGRWSALLVGADGADVAPDGGDVLRVADRDGAYELAVPPLAVRFGRGSDVVTGTTTPGARVDVERTGARPGTGDAGLPPEQAAYAGATARPPSDAVATAPPRAAAGVAAADGAFTVRLGADVALRGDDEVRVVVTHGGIRRVARRRVPFLRVAVHPGEVTVFLRPSARVTVTLRGPGGREATGYGRTDRDGRATVWLHDAAFRRLAPRPGDDVRASDGETALALRLPPFEAGHDLAANALHGTGTAGDPVDITLWNPWYPGELDEPRAVVGADGRWRATAAVALHPASHYYVTEHLPGGDRLFRCYQVPMLHVEPGSAVVGVQALYFADARLSLERDGRVVATGRPTAPWVEVGPIVLRDATGAAVAARPGDVVRATLDGVEAAAEVDVLTAAVEAAAGAIVGTAPPGAALTLVRTSPLATTTADDAGRYWFPPSEDAALQGVLPRPGVELAVVERLPSGHFRRARLIGPTIEAGVGTRTVAGVAAAGATVVVRRGADEAMAVAGADDRYTVTLPAATAVVTGGDVVTLAVGAWSTTLAVASLTAQFDARTGRLFGHAAGDSVAVQVWAGAADAPERWFVAADPDDGAWAVDLTRPGPGAAPIDPSAVRRIEAAVRDGGHAVRWSWPGGG